LPESDEDDDEAVELGLVSDDDEDDEEEVEEVDAADDAALSLLAAGRLSVL
jgi:hypothetical protein